MVCQQPSQGYNRFFLQLLTTFRAQFGENSAGDAASFQLLLAERKTEHTEWPDDDAFEKAWLDLDAYTELGPGRVVMVLRALEDALHGPKTESTPIGGPLNVEHVLPQKWETHWPLPGVSDAQTERDVRSSLLHDFGNLTLVTPSFNSSLSNDPAKEKLPEIDRHSVLMLNKHFGAGKATWTEQDIRERSKRLFALALKVWAKP